MNEELALLAEQPIGRFHFFQMILVGMLDEGPPLVAVEVAEVARVLGVFLVSGFADGATQMVPHGCKVGEE